MKNNQRFKRGSGVFNCRNCQRSTRDTNGSNGYSQLCEDCYDGCEQENGFFDSEGELKAQYERDMKACFQRAVDKGGIIRGYVKGGQL